jgi:hypothetical protein
MPCPSQYVICSTNHEVPHRTIFSSPRYVMLLTIITYKYLGVNEWVAPWFLWVPTRRTIVTIVLSLWSHTWVLKVAGCHDRVWSVVKVKGFVSLE